MINVEKYTNDREEIVERFVPLLKYKYKLLTDKELPDYIEQKLRHNGSFTIQHDLHTVVKCIFFTPKDGRYMQKDEKLPIKCFEVDIKKAKIIIDKLVSQIKKEQEKKEQEKEFAKNNPNLCFDCGTKVEHQPNFMMDASSWRCPKCNSSYTKYNMEQENILHRG